MAAAGFRTAVAVPRLRRPTRTRYSTEPTAGRRTNSWAGRMNRPAAREPRTASAAVAATTPVTMTALAARTPVRRGNAVSVTRTIPVLYSLPITSTASMAMTA